MATPPRPTRVFSKAALSTDDLITFLKAKGLTIDDEQLAKNKINLIGYYRLKIYMRPLELPTKKFKNGMTFDDIVYLYEFDRKLRLIVLDAIERIEVALRATLINIMCAAGGPHFYYDETFFENKYSVTFMRDLAERSKHLSIKHYKSTYHTPFLAPIWCVTEASSFGNVSRLFADLNLPYRKSIAKYFGIDETILVSWLRSINTIRNLCAHHGRLWNAELLVDTPMISKKYEKEMVKNTRIYSRLVVIRAILNGFDKNYSDDWARNIKTFMSKHTGVDVGSMDFPKDWASRPIWN